MIYFKYWNKNLKQMHAKQNYRDIKLQNLKSQKKMEEGESRKKLEDKKIALSIVILLYQLNLIWGDKGLKIRYMCWGFDLVDKVLIVQRWGPELGSLKP